MTDFDMKVLDNFPGKAVRKDLTALMKKGSNVPTYVLEYLLGMAAGDAAKVGERAVLWMQGALASGNAVHEHCLEIYLAWLLSSDDPGEIYTEAEDWIRLRGGQGRLYRDRS